MSFKENLQYLRGSRNMTQEQLAMLLGVSRQAISKWESEKAYPEMDKLLMLCDMFGVTLDDLVMGDVRASAGCGGAGRVDLAADTDGVAASVGVADAAVGAVPGVIGFAASQVAGMSDSGESDVRDTNPNVCASVSGESDAQGAKTGVQLSVSPESDTRDGTDIPQSVPRHIVQDVVGYDSHMRRFAWLIAIGVAANHPRRRGWHVVFAGGVCLGAVAGERRAGHGMHVGWRDGRSRFADTGRNHAWRFPPSPPVCAGFLHE